MKKNFHFIRHGESESNAGQKTTHPRTINLTYRGRSEAHDKAAEFVAKPDLIITSKYVRTKQTAEPFLKKFGEVPQEEWDIHEFTYLPVEKYKDTTNVERRPAIDAYWDRADPQHKENGTGESFAEFATRCRAAIEKVKTCPAPFAIAFCHGYMMRGILFALEGRFDVITGATMAAFWHTHRTNKIHNCAYLDFETDGQTLRLNSHDLPVQNLDGAFIID